MSYNFENELEGVSEKYRNKIHTVYTRGMGGYGEHTLFEICDDLTGIRLQRLFELIEHLNIDMNIDTSQYEVWEDSEFSCKDIVVERIVETDTRRRLFDAWGCSDLPDFIGKLEELHVATEKQFEYACPYPGDLQLKVKFTFKSALREILLEGIKVN